MTPEKTSDIARSGDYGRQEILTLWLTSFPWKMIK